MLPVSDEVINQRDKNRKFFFIRFYYWINNNLKSFSFYVNILFWIGALATAMQGFFSISFFVNSVLAIPAMAFLSLMPIALLVISTLSILSAIIIGTYSLIVEQQVFKKHFQKLMRQLFTKTEEKTNDKLTKELKQEIKQLDKHIDNETENKVKQDKYNLLWLLRLIHKSFAHFVASCVVGLRALVSIGSTMLGIKVLLLLTLSPFGITALPAAIIPLCAIAAAVGYFIKTSQNIIDQFNQTLKFLGLEKYVKTDYIKARKELKQSLKRIFKEKNNKEYQSKNKKNETLPFWKLIVCRIMDIGFVFGAIGASMQGFFSISKFVSQMGAVPLLSFFNTIPVTVIFGSAALIAIYTLCVEQKILYQYFNSLIVGWMQPNISTDRCVYEITNRKLSKDDIEKDYKLKLLKPGRDYSLDLQDDKTNVDKIIFHSKLAYKIYKLNHKIDKIYNHPVLINAKLRRSSKSIDNQQLKNITVPKYGFLKLNFARIGSVFILLLRAVTSIVPTVLGLVTAINLLMFFVGLTPLGPVLFIPAGIMATFGYLIKCSQNLYNHYSKTMSNMFGIKHDNSEQQLTAIINNLRNEKIDALILFNKHKDNYITPDKAADNTAHAVEVSHSKDPMIMLHNLPTNDGRKSPDTTPVCKLYSPASPIIRDNDPDRILSPGM